MLESFLKVSPFKFTLKLPSSLPFCLALTLSLLMFSTISTAQVDDSQTQLVYQISSSPEVRATGLELGNELTHAILKGHVRIQCADYLVAAASEFDCSMDTLEPFTLSRFQTATSVNADHFDLQIQHQKSWTSSKSGVYLPSSGSSQLSLNLWNSSILDWPILADGVNVATYRLTKAGKQVEVGIFTVDVSTVTRTCTPTTVVSYNPGDCRNQRAACDRYFFQNNHCLAR